MLLARVGMLGALLGLGACTIPNDAHCGNQGGDATCSERFGAPMYCDICVAANDGCVEAMPEDACRLGEHASDGSASDTSTSTSTDPTTAASTAASSTTTPLSTAGPGESSAESTTDAPDDSTSTTPTDS